MPKPKKTKEVQVIEPSEATSVDSFIAKALEVNASVETMEKLFALHKEVKAEKAKEAFIRALSDFQAECPIIEKNRDVKNKDGSLRYSYAPLDSIVSQVKGTLGKYNLSYTTDVINEPGFIVAVCKITHVLGHSETSSFKIPIDTEGFMTAPQKYASALTFGKRYAFCNALGIMTGEDDFDATDVEKKPEIEGLAGEKGKITFLLKELGDNTEDKDSIITSIKKRTGITVADDLQTLFEIRNRLEILVQEKNHANA